MKSRWKKRVKHIRRKREIPPLSAKDLKEYIADRISAVDRGLDRYLPGEDIIPHEIHRAMRYSVFSGGKRIRPILAIAACEACGGRRVDAVPAACAIEIVHAYSLIHDDLPSMDNDDLRRGKPSCHKKFGEGIAILAGDGLLTLAFEILSTQRNGIIASTIVKELALAIGTLGMIGGQVIDLENKGKDVDLPTLEYMNAHKTGSLIATSLKIGAITARTTKRKVKAIWRYGEFLGLAFQVVDDILDKEGYAKLLGAAEARREATLFIEKAKDSLYPLGKRAQVLKALADYILERKD
ncbi:MAG: polyprenyl synthetase family protein [Candidatus Omnitrophica bacterium]|nr:polyprenyl synthetase family protein [Candidatus Omnitrophota bacterium]